MNTHDFAALTALNDLAAAGYRPVPMIPGGDGAAGWGLPNGDPVEFGEHFAAQALDQMPADASAERGIVAGDGILIVQARGALRDLLPETPATWVAGDCRTSIYRAPEVRLSELMEFGFVRSFGWHLPVARHHMLARIAAKASAVLGDKDAAHEHRLKAHDVLARAERAAAFRVHRPDCLIVMERDCAVVVPDDVVLPANGSLPVFTEDDIANVMDAVGAYDGEVWPERSAKPHDPVAAWTCARNAKECTDEDGEVRHGKVRGLFCDDVLIPSECPPDPFKRERAEAEAAWLAEYHARRAAHDEAVQREAEARALAEVFAIAKKEAAQKAVEARDVVQVPDATPTVQAAPMALAGNLVVEDQRHKQQQAAGVPSLPFKVELFGADSGFEDSVSPPSLYANAFNRGEVFLTVAAPGVGKTTLMVDEAVCLALGKPLLGVPVPSPLNVLLLNLEDQTARIKQRIRAFCQMNGIDPRDFPGKLLVAGAVEIGGAMIIGCEERGSFKINESALAGLRAIVQTYGIDIVMVDPLVSMHHGNENASGAMDSVLKALARMGMDLGFAIHINHHSGKLPRGMTRVTLSDGRGSSAIEGAIRGGRVINHVTEEERERAMDAGLTREQAKRLLCVDYQKVSFGEPKPREFYAIQSHDVMRPGHLLPLYRSSGMIRVRLATSTRLTDDEIEDVRASIKPQWCRKSHKSPQWVGYSIGPALDLDMTDKANKARVQTIINDLLKRGALMTVRGQKANRGETEDVAANPDWKPGYVAPVIAETDLETDEE